MSLDTDPRRKMHRQELARKAPAGRASQDSSATPGCGVPLARRHRGARGGGGAKPAGGTRSLSAQCSLGPCSRDPGVPPSSSAASPGGGWAAGARETRDGGGGGAPIQPRNLCGRLSAPAGEEEFLSRDPRPRKQIPERRAHREIVGGSSLTPSSCFGGGRRSRSAPGPHLESPGASGSGVEPAPRSG